MQLWRLTNGDSCLYLKINGFDPVTCFRSGPGLPRGLPVKMDITAILPLDILYTL